MKLMQRIEFTVLEQQNKMHYKPSWNLETHIPHD